MHMLKTGQWIDMCMTCSPLKGCVFIIPEK
jgi:hypothetical protein